MAQALKVWVTRARPGADATAERLRALGHEPLVAPLLEVRALPRARSTSTASAPSPSPAATASTPSSPATPGRDWPVFAVGDATAEAARAAGFADVASASGDVAALAELIIAQRRGRRAAARRRRRARRRPRRPRWPPPASPCRPPSLYETVAQPVSEAAAPPGRRWTRCWSTRPRPGAPWPRRRCRPRAPAASACPRRSPRPLGPLADPKRTLVAPEPDGAALLALLNPPRRLFPLAWWLALLFAMLCSPPAWPSQPTDPPSGPRLTGPSPALGARGPTG